MLTWTHRNQNLSHITSGYIYNSPVQSLVRADEAYNGAFGSSLFNYHNTTEDGLVDNILTTYNSTFTRLDVWRGYVNPGFPLITDDFLAKEGASFGGLVHRDFVGGKVASVRTPFWFLHLRQIHITVIR